MVGVYETIRVKDGTIPLLQRHVARLVSNCHATGLAEPENLADQIRSIGRKMPPDVKLRVTWDGESLVFTNMGLPDVSSLRVHTALVRHGGYTVKTTDREIFDRARAEAHDAGADEALLLTHEGYVAEGTLFAVAWFDEAVLRLPSLDLGILPSIGRGRVIQVAEQLGFSIEEGAYPRSSLDGRTVFGTTATRGVVKIETLDGVALPFNERLGVLAANFWPRAGG